MSISIKFNFIVSNEKKTSYSVDGKMEPKKKIEAIKQMNAFV